LEKPDKNENTALQKYRMEEEKSIDCYFSKTMVVNIALKE
jgi:hypothetical protein